MGNLIGGFVVNEFLVHADFWRAVDAVEQFIGQHEKFNLERHSLACRRDKESLWAIHTVEGQNIWGEIELFPRGNETRLTAVSIHQFDNTWTAVKWYVNKLQEHLGRLGLLYPPRPQRTPDGQKVPPQAVVSQQSPPISVTQHDDAWLRETIRKSEGLKLDFKREFHLGETPPVDTDKQLWKRYVDGQWDEFIKDIIALANGNSGTAGQTGHLIIGADNELQSDGRRKIHDTSGLLLNPQQILAKVNSACDPPIQDIEIKRIVCDGKTVQVVVIPPTPHLHETIRQLEVTKGEFDSSGVLRHVKVERPYTAHTAFVRRGEGTFPAKDSERQAIREEKASLMK